MLSTFRVISWFAAENEFEVKNTLSLGVGAHTFPEPPSEVDQWAGSLQLPVPPIQYMFLGACCKIVMPVLLPPSTEFSAVIVPLPVKEISLILKLVAVVTPLT